MQKVYSVAGVVFNPERTSVLLIERRDVPVWTLPGGGVDPGEEPKEAVIREIQEETGLIVSADRLVGSYTPINRLTRFTQVFECTQLGGVLGASIETKSAQFFPLSQLPLFIPPPFRDWIKDATRRDPPLCKTIDSVTYTALALNLIRHPLLVARFLLARLGYPINSGRADRGP